MAAAELVLDPGVLEATPTIEFGGWRAAAATHGPAVLPWRRDWRAARAADVDAHPDVEGVGDARFAQALVHLQKSRDATWHDLGAAWDRLAPGGRLLLCGGNELGVVSAVKRLARELDRPPRVLANRRRARVVLFERARTGTEAAAPVAPEPRRIAFAPDDGADLPPLAAAPGVFSARRLDPGTEMLLEAIRQHARAPARVLDLGCGIGPLGLAALRRWPDAAATLLDGDARAIASARENARALGVDARGHLAWWDAEEPVPGGPFDLVLSNPPFHTGKQVDLAPARAMFVRASEAMAPGARALIVANRTLPWERDLQEIGRLRTLAETRHYKVLEVRRRSRSSSPSRRQSRGARSSGSA